jgi:2-oxoglutarate dehydrogenase E2 component (dihydrolipoamide succinyltransferase)
MQGNVPRAVGSAGFKEQAMAIDVEIPGMGESVTEVILIEWLKGEGEQVERDEPICILETDKANVDLPAPAAGVMQQLKAVDDTLEVGDVIARIAEGASPGIEPAGAPGVVEEEPVAAEADEETLSPAVRRLIAENDLEPAAIEGTGKGGRLTKEDVLAHLAAQEEEVEPAEQAPPVETPKVEEPREEAPPAKSVQVAKPAPAAKPAQVAKLAPKAAKMEKGAEGDGIRRVPMTRIRQRIAQHLVGAQQNAAMLTTFNEVDMSGVMALRAEYKEQFTEIHGVSLGFMSFFSRAVAMALREFEVINARIDGEEIVYHDYVNLGIAVGTERGLVVPVLQRVEQMSMAEIESEIKRVALGARDNRLSMDDLTGGTFTITNGGVFGSLLSTPILNAPQSGILGMHAIQQRPVAVDGKVEIRPMMYVALSYDHRLVDGQQSVSFLVRVKQLVEDPVRLLLQV